MNQESKTHIWTTQAEYYQILNSVSKDEALSSLIGGSMSELASIKRLLNFETDKEEILEFIDSCLYDYKQLLDYMKGE